MQVMLPPILPLSSYSGLNMYQSPSAIPRLYNITAVSLGNNAIYTLLRSTVDADGSQAAYYCMLPLKQEESGTDRLGKHR